MPDPDPRDEIVYGARALRGLADLINEVGQCRQSFDLVGPAELGELLGMVEERIARATKGMENYRPRD
jgi:hypothetical protein